MDDVVVIGQSMFWYGHLLGRDDVAVHVVDGSPGLRDGFAGARSLVTVGDLDSVDALTWAAGELLAAGVRPRAVAVGSEMTQLGRGYLAAALGLPTPTPALASRTRDKRIMKTLARAAGVPVADFVGVPDPAEPGDAIGAVGFPCVVKPVSGAGSQLTYVCRDRRELEHALSRQRTPAMVERYVAGREFHCDAVWRDGEPWIFMVSEYGVAPIDLNRGHGSVVSMVHHPGLRPQLYADALRLCQQVNDALGITDGPTHLEFFATDEGLVFSEVATRMAGGIFPGLARVWCGTDLREICTHEALGLPKEALTLHDAPFAVTGMVNIPTPRTAGVITSLPSLDDIAREPNVVHVESVARVGQRVDPAIEGGHPWGVLVVVGVDSTTDVFATADALNARYRLTVG